jgi:7-cyano-7-deazaguanine reductase
MNMTPEQSNLGKQSHYPKQYDPRVLFPLPRLPKREEIGITTVLPFSGSDIWTAYELSWLNTKGKPVVAIGHFVFDCTSPYLIESKSLKLYLNSFNNSVFEGIEHVLETLKKDLSQVVWSDSNHPQRVGVEIIPADDFLHEIIVQQKGIYLDLLDIACDCYQVDATLLRVCDDAKIVTEALTSNLLKSNCLVTGQPDWGSIQICYTGPAIDHESLLRYVVSYRNHNGFHEQCIERIYMDIWSRCQPTKLNVYGRYSRRGGLDINPFRSSHPISLPKNIRDPRQ